MKNLIKISACAPPRCSCPVLTLNVDDLVVDIDDDFNNSVHMTVEEFIILAEKFTGYLPNIAEKRALTNGYF